MKTTKKLKQVLLDPFESVKCPLCGQMINDSSDACEHVIGIEFNGELSENVGWPDTKSWWKTQEERDQNIEVSLATHPKASHVVIMSDGPGCQCVYFGNAQ